VYDTRGFSFAGGFRVNSGDASPLKYNHLVWTFALFVILHILLYAPRLNSDGAYYYEYVRSLVIQNDLNFDDEREFFTWEWVPVFREYLPGSWKDTGYPPNIFSFGPAIFWLPFYLVSHWLILLINFFGGHLSTNGYTLIDRFLPTLTSLLAGLGIIIINDKILYHAGFEKRDRNAALFFMLGASNLPAFLFVTPAFSHAISTLASCAFYLMWYRWRGSDWDAKHYGLYGAMAGAIMLARWQNAFSLILPLCDAAVSLKTASTPLEFRKRLLRWLAFAGVFLAVLTPQLIVTWIIYGTPVTDPQGTGGMHWLTPEFRIVLFEGRMGLYTVNPILLPATLGIVFIFRKNFRLGWGMTLIFLVHLYINAIRRDWAGVGFGMRRFLDVLPVFSLGLAAWFELARNRFRTLLRKFFYLSGFCLIVWNLLLMAQYYLSSLGAPWTKLSHQEMIHRQFTMSPGLLLELVKSGSWGSGISGHAVDLALAFFATAAVLAFIMNIISDRPGFDFLKGRKPIRALAAILSAVVLIDGWLVFSVMRSSDFFAISLVPDRKFGFLRHLVLNKSSGYLGFPGGLVFRPGNQLCKLSLKPEYDGDRFLELGHLRIEDRQPCISADRQIFSFPLIRSFTGLVFISRVEPALSSIGQTVGTIRIVDDFQQEHLFPVRLGIETGCSPNENLPGNVDLLQRIYPAVNRVANGENYDTRTTFNFQSPLVVREMEIKSEELPLEWEIHGIAFY
jgi:hypothetical protein